MRCRGVRVSPWGSTTCWACEVRKLLIAVLVLALFGVGGWFGDGWLRHESERQVAESIATEFNAQEVTVRLGGPVFTWSALTKSIPDAELEAKALTIPMAGRSIELTGISASSGPITWGDTEADIQQLTATANLSYEQLSALAGVPITFESPDRLALTYQTTLLGYELELQVSAKPILDPVAARLELGEIKAGINGVSFEVPVDQETISQVVRPIDLRLDYGMVLDQVEPGPGGLALGVSGQQVQIPLS